jgi:hypothetical protein
MADRGCVVTRAYKIYVGDEEENDPVVVLHLEMETNEEWITLSTRLLQEWPSILSQSDDDFTDPPRRVREWLTNQGIKTNEEDVSDGIVLSYRDTEETLLNMQHED